MTKDVSEMDIVGVAECEVFPGRTNDEDTVVEVVLDTGRSHSVKQIVERFRGDRTQMVYVESMYGKDRRYNSLLDDIVGPHRTSVRSVLSTYSADTVLDEDGTVIGRLEVDTDGL